MKSVCILSQSHLCRNPRVWKEAFAVNKYYSVTIITCFYDNKLLQEDLQLIGNRSIKYIPYVDIRKKNLTTLISKAIRKIAISALQYLGLETAYALGYAPNKLLKAALNQRSDKYIVHQEMPSWVGIQLLKKGETVYFDLEDWYSEDLLPAARKKRPIKLLEKIEKIALSSSSGSWTTSVCMAKAMSDKYKSIPPKSIYNSFPDNFFYKKKIEALEYKDRSDLTTPSLFWFSQTIGPGRGLEELMKALQSIEHPFQLHLRGNINEQYRNKLIKSFPNYRNSLFFHSPIPNHELPQRIAEHDIGLALEKNTPLSRNYTITNKILQYLQSGLAIIASDTEGQKEVALKAKKALFLFGKSDDNLTKVINSLISDNDKILHSKQEARIAYLNNFSWKNEKKKLFRYIK
jgi:glycosyltransferase involved in cell wall biosynthesis